MKYLSWRMIPIFVFVVLLLLFWRGLSLDPHHLPSTRVGKMMPEFQLPLLNDHKHSLTPKDFQGHMSLLTVWASWCDACAREQPFLLKLQQKGVLIYGINYKDTPTDAKKWLAEWGNPYQLIAEDVDGHVAIDLGVYGAPETFLVNKKGMILYRHVGILNEQVWQTKFLALMKEG